MNTLIINVPDEPVMHFITTMDSYPAEGTIIVLDSFEYLIKKIRIVFDKNSHSYTYYVPITTQYPFTEIIVEKIT